jgi:cell wall-associated NlpC family hydrolase
MTRQFQILVFFLVALSLAGCSNVRLAIYDYQKRKEYADQSKTAYLNTSAGKVFTLKKSMVETAHEYLGSPYRYGGMDAKKGFDCSGFVCTVAKKNNLVLPRSSTMMAQDAPHVAWKKAGSGDLVFFGDHGKIHHVGIIEKNTGKTLQVIHSTSQRGVISENVLESDYWRKRVLFAVDITSFQKNNTATNKISSGS